MLSFSRKSDVVNWLIYFGNQKINKKWNWHNELQYRNDDFAGDLQKLLLRTGIEYNLTENNNNILLGYAFTNSQRYLPNSEDKSG
jgi:intein/homing endonuclease